MRGSHPGAPLSRRTVLELAGAAAANAPKPDRGGTFRIRLAQEIVCDIQRSCSRQVYYACGPSASVVAAWMPNVRDFGPNIGPDYGGRLTSAWLER